MANARENFEDALLAERVVIRTATSRNDIEHELRALGFGLNGRNQLTQGINELNAFVSFKPGGGYQIFDGMARLIWTPDSGEDLEAAVNKASAPRARTPRDRTPEPEARDSGVAKLEAISKVKCQMERDCPIPATYTDGMEMYCAKHAKIRSNHRRCRKLKPSEIRSMNSDL